MSSQSAQNTQSRWIEVNVIFRGWNVFPCKTKSQNPKFYDKSFICGQYDHHSHWFCSRCGMKAPNKYYYQSPESVECECSGKRTCHFCKQPGHLQVNCWEQLGRTGPSERNRKRCYICKRRGHELKTCPNKLQKMPRPSEGDKFATPV